MLTEGKKYRWAVFFVAGLLTSIIIILYNKIEKDLIPDVMPYCLVPGILFGIVLAFLITKITIYPQKWKTFIMITAWSIVASSLSVYIAIYLSMGSMFHTKTLLYNDYASSIISGLAGGIIVSLIPNAVLRTRRMTILNLWTSIASAALGLLLLVLGNINEYGQCIGYSLWFSIIGVLTLNNYEVLLKSKQVTIA